MMADGQVPRESEAQVSASRVLEDRPKSKHFTVHQKGSQDLGVPQGSHESPSNLKYVSRTDKVMKIGPKSTPNHKKRTLES